MLWEANHDLLHTSTAADLSALADSVAREIGAGSFNQVTEVKGAIECDAPLTGELSLVPCVHYAMSVRREWEETAWKTDSQGRRTEETRKGSDTVASNTRSVRFRVKDATGAVDVDPSAGKIDGEKAVSQFQPGEPSGGVALLQGLHHQPAQRGGARAEGRVRGQGPLDRRCGLRSCRSRARGARLPWHHRPMRSGSCDRRHVRQEQHALGIGKNCLQDAPYRATF
jgi:hypothetical protein